MKTILLAAALTAFAAPALAQSTGDAATGATTTAPLPDPNDNSDTFTIGVGAAYLPDYEGSNDYRIIPAAAVRGRISGISFFSRATYLYADFIPRGAGKLDFDAGPIAGVRLNRSGKIKDDFVDLLPRRHKAFEVGGFVGVTAHGLTNPYDALSVRLDVVKDVGNAHQSVVVTPTLDFGTPVSRRTYVGASLSADFVSNRFADYYFSVSPGEANATAPISPGGLVGHALIRSFDAKGGYKGWKAGLLANQSITGDLTHGLSLFATGSYGRLSGDFKRSPLVADFGSATQWMGAVGLGYTF